MHLFTYGSLVFPAVMEAVTGRRFECVEARLHGYRRRMLRGRVYPGVRPDACETTTGRLYLGLDAATLACLDDFEGDEYERRQVVLDLDEDARAAETYVLTRAAWPLLTDAPWRPERFTALHLPEYLRRCRRFRRAWLADEGRVAGAPRSLRIDDDA